MEKSRSSYVLIALAAVFIIGFYSVDLKSNNASVVSLPDFSSNTDIEKPEQKPTPTLSEFNDAIVDVAEKAKSTVVTVTVTQTVEARQNPLARFFGNPRDQQPEEYQRQGLGSGVIVSNDGYILTNNHVVEKADEVEVQLYNDKQYKAEVIGTDPRTDIAVLKIDAENLDVIKLGNSEKTRVGEMVLAIGSPLQPGLAHSVSMGIISAKDRSIGILKKQEGYENFLQTDAAINPGNSGGALINMDGELIGINSAIASRSGGSDGIGFAVPVDIAKRVMKSIIQNGRVIRAYLGIAGQDITPTLAKALNLESNRGIVINQVNNDTPAEEAGLQEGDVIQKLNGKEILNYDNFRTNIATSTPGDKIQLHILRDGATKQLTVTLSELPSELAMDQQSTPDKTMEKQLGFRVQELTPDIANQLNLSQGQEGVVVAQVSQRSEAYRQGLRQGHVITSVGNQSIADISDFNDAVNNLLEQEKDIALLRVLAGENSRLVAFEL